MTHFNTLTTIQKARRNSKRIGQREILPISISNRLLGDIVLITDVAQGTSTLSNGDDVTFVITTSSKDGERNITVVDLSVYIGSVAANNQLPGGNTINESQWEVFLGSSNDWGLSNNNNTKTLIYIRNISAGASKSIIVKTQSRSIVNTTT